MTLGFRGKNAHINHEGIPKVGYRTKGKAQQVAAHVRKETGIRFDVYRCRVCREWHIGRTTPVWKQQEQEAS